MKIRIFSSWRINKSGRVHQVPAAQICSAPTCLEKARAGDLCVRHRERAWKTQKPDETSEMRFLTAHQALRAGRPVSDPLFGPNRAELMALLQGKPGHNPRNR